ncbi:hypothetical protein ACFQ1O_11055 [Pseudofulvibacter geojedonensis]|uniref:Uncharacterized protein n=2 Tax=Pseudofulvibacter geojedonensis TaxID=1123758 RepID=A0ABW3I443_9FLAO
MYYYLIPETDTGCVDDFPSGLSYFFEQVGGYDEYATVSQLENELDIDLSLFQNIYIDDKSIFEEMEKYGEIRDAEEEFKKHAEKTKIRTESMFDLLLIFKNKLEKNRDFANKIKFNSNKELSESIRTLYPPEIEYYKNGKFLKDLDALISIINCYKKNGVRYLRLGYA